MSLRKFKLYSNVIRYRSNFDLLAYLIVYSRYCLIYEQYFPFNIAVLNSSLNPLKVDFFYQDFALAFIATKWSHVIIAPVNQRSLPSDHQ